MYRVQTTISSLLRAIEQATQPSSNTVSSCLETRVPFTAKREPSRVEYFRRSGLFSGECLYFSSCSSGSDTMPSKVYSCGKFFFFLLSKSYESLVTTCLYRILSFSLSSIIRTFFPSLMISEFRIFSFSNDTQLLSSSLRFFKQRYFLMASSLDTISIKKIPSLEFSMFPITLC